MCVCVCACACVCVCVPVCVSVCDTRVRVNVLVCDERYVCERMQMYGYVCDLCVHVYGCTCKCKLVALPV